MIEFGFQKDVDYVLLTQTGEQKGRGGHNKTDYILTLEMAKHIAIVQRMIDYGFTKDVDYTLVIQKRLTNNPKNPHTEETDYILTLEMAKHIAMLQRSEIGMTVRKYFIDK